MFILEYSTIFPPGSWSKILSIWSLERGRLAFPSWSLFLSSLLISVLGIVSECLTVVLKIALNEYLTLPFFNQLIKSELALLLWLKHVSVLRRHVFSVHLATFSFKSQLQGLLFLLSLKGPWNLALHLKHNSAFFKRVCLSCTEGSSYSWILPRAPHSLLQISEEL